VEGGKWREVGGLKGSSKCKLKKVHVVGGGGGDNNPCFN